MRAAIGQEGQTVANTKSWTAGSDGKSLAELAVKCKSAPSTVLRLTTEHTGQFPGPVAARLSARRLCWRGAAFVRVSLASELRGLKRWPGQ